jgi:hypothetical protein
VVLTAAALAAPLIASAAAADLYYERTVMVAADARCRLFEPAVGSALAAAQAQARGAALRSGVDEASLKATASRALARVAAVDCRSKDIAVAAGRVRTAFEAYAQINRIPYPGDLSSWQADRTPGRTATSWRLVQPASFGADKMVFGLAGKGTPGSLTAVVAFADKAMPYTARIVMRDPARLGRAFIDTRGVAPGAKPPLTARVAPRNMSLAYAASSRATAPLGLLPRGEKSAVAFGFPDNAAAMLAGLDPREAVTVEFVFAGRAGDTVRTAYIEVGDFAAGRAFLTVPQR